MAKSKRKGKNYQYLENQLFGNTYSMRSNDDDLEAGDKDSAQVVFIGLDDEKNLSVRSSRKVAVVMRHATDSQKRRSTPFISACLSFKGQ